MVRSFLALWAATIAATSAAEFVARVARVIDGEDIQKIFSGGYYSRNGKGRACPKNQRRTCMTVLPVRPDQL
jgi:hypothetical protein